MTRRGSIAVYVLLLVCVAAAWLVSSSPAAVLAGALLLLLPGLSLAWNALARKRLTAKLSVQTFAEKGEQVQGVLRVQCGRLFVPAGRLSAKVRTENALTGECETVSLALHPDGEAYTASFQFASLYCGYIRFTVERLQLRDIFSVFTLSVPMNASAACTVLPRTFSVEIADPALPRTAGDANEVLPVGGGSDFTEVYQLRDYVPGDSVRGIHWLLSAKRDTLIFRDPALAVQRSLLLFWDQTDAAPDAADALAEAFFSVSQSLAEFGLPFSLAFVQNDTLQTETITDMDALSGVLPLLLRGSQGSARPDVSAYGRTLWFTATGSSPDASGVTAIACLKHGGTAPHGIVFSPGTVREALHRLDWNYEG